MGSRVEQDLKGMADRLRKLHLPGMAAQPLIMTEKLLLRTFLYQGLADQPNFLPGMLLFKLMKFHLPGMAAQLHIHIMTKKLLFMSRIFGLPGMADQPKINMDPLQFNFKNLGLPGSVEQSNFMLEMLLASR